MDLKQLRLILLGLMIIGLSGFVRAQSSGMPCIDQVNLSIDPACTATITPAIMQSGTTTGVAVGIKVGVLPAASLSGGSVVNGFYRGPAIVVNLQLVPAFVSKGKIGPIEVSVFDESNNSCWGKLTIEDKLPPVISDVADITVTCLVPTDAAGNPDTSVTGVASASGTCSGVASIDYRDQTTEIPCSPTNDIIKTIIRTWYVTNKNGVSASSVQNITVRTLNVDTLIIQPLVEVGCNDAITPAALAAALGDDYGYPVLVDTSGAMFPVFPDQAICNVVASFSDSKPIDFCGVGCFGGSKTLRTWIILDWCSGNVATLTQLIKRVDEVAPEIDVESPTKTYSVDAWGCETDIALPKAIVTDNCDAEPRVLTVYGPVGVQVQNKGNGQFVAIDVPKGTHTFVYTAADCCGNTAIDSITLTVVDKVAPVATAKEFITVSLTRSGDSTVTGVAKIFPSQIDNGSYDNCTPVYLEIRREAGSPDCLNEGIDGYNNNLTYNSTINGLEQTTALHKEDAAKDTDHGQYVKFCCEDIGDTVKVWLRVWDDADGDGIFGSAGDNYNETWAQVKVEDKIVPKIYCENDITTSCDRADVFYNLDGLWHDVAGSAIPAEFIPWVDGVCSNYELEYRDAGSFTACNTTPEGKPIVRTYRVKGFPQVTCTMTITIENTESDPVLEYPIALHNWTKCTLTEQEVLENTIRANVKDGYYYEVERIEGGGCASVASNILPHDSTTNGVTPTGGFLVAAQQGKSRFNPNYKDVGCNVFGRHITIEDYVVGTGCRKWLVKFDYINWCNNGYAGCRSTVYKFEDTTPPTITTCPSYTVEVDQASCTAAQAVAPVGSDAGGCETAMNWIVTLVSPSGVEIAERTGTGNAPKFSAFTGLNPGVYTVEYKLTDGCGNVAECEGTITVIPKDPTPYCISLSSAVMQNGIVELWAKDFDKGSFLNCDANETGFLLFTFNMTPGAASHPVDSLLTEEHYFKGLGLFATKAEYDAGNAQRWIPEVEETVWPGGGIKKTLKGGTSGMLFGCTVGDPVRVAFPVEMRVWDSRYFVPGTNEGSDFCRVSLTLENNQGDTACPAASTGNRIVGTVATMSGEGVSDVETSLDANLPEFPVKAMTAAGSFSFNNLTSGVEYEISAKKDLSYRNGVNTLDLLRIQRHILNITRLDDAHKIIAADANNDLKVDVNDLVELRKLVLGVIDDLPRNQSWRFVDAKQTFTDMTNPWPLQEVIVAKADQSSVYNFIAVKVGDVDINASTSATSQTTTRSGKAVSFIMDDAQLTAGEVASIDVKAENFNEVFGYQFAAQLSGVEVVDVVSKAIQIEASMFAQLENGLFTMSYNNINGVSVANNEVLFTIKVKATNTTKLSTALVASNEIVEAEAYVGNDFVAADAKLEVRGGQAKGMVLYQNVPNPFKAETNINFSVPEASNVTFKVFDVTGKLLMNRVISASKGENMITLRRSDLGANGVLYYQLESGDQIQTRKMVIIE